MALCWICNPMCGKCTPPQMKGIGCPSCGTTNVFDLQLSNKPEKRICKQCGSDLTWETVPHPTYCQRYEISCGNPCLQADEVVSVMKGMGTCPSRTAPIKRPNEPPQSKTASSPQQKSNVHAGG